MIRSSVIIAPTLQKNLIYLNRYLKFGTYPEMTSEYFVQSADGTRLRVVESGTGKRNLLIVHGLAEHTGRYDHVAHFFHNRGWKVTRFELRGHGKSAGKRGHVQRWSDYVSDVHTITKHIPENYCAIAHSMGGLVALDAALNGFQPKRLALSNPLLGVKIEAPWVKVTAAKLLSRVIPWLPIPNELDSSWLSRDLSVGKQYDKDPLVFRTVTPRWYTEMTAALTRVHQNRCHLPLSFFLSDDDRITDCNAARRYAGENGAQVKFYPQMRHEIFNEFGKEDVFNDIATWLENAS